MWYNKGRLRKAVHIMNKYSLITIYEESSKTISGVWLQDYYGSLKEAKTLARETEEANSNRIVIAVTKRLKGSCPDYDIHEGLKRLG